MNAYRAVFPALPFSAHLLIQRASFAQTLESSYFPPHAAHRPSVHDSWPGMLAASVGTRIIPRIPSACEPVALLRYLAADEFAVWQIVSA
ncbi:hypothetical protein D1872_222420 [compost metagenome]